MHFDTAHDLAANQGNRMALFALMQWALTLPLYIVTVIVLNFYLVDCLFNERKDRSILFWKSLPVSDAATVASKLLVGLVVVPLGVYVLALATNLLFSAIWIARSSLHFTEVVAIWDTMTWLKVEALMLLGLLVSILWYAPLAAYLVLVSALARRSALLWATLPPVFVILAEKLALGTHHLTDLIEYRTWGIWQIMHLDEVTRHTVSVNGHEQHELVSLPAFFHAMDIGQVFANVDLWLGLAVAAVLAFAAVQIRRYRDDT
jgi:ABC-2 type transport system permease protein